MTTKCEHVPENGDSATTSYTKCGRVIEWNRNTLRWILFGNYILNSLGGSN